MKRFYCLLSISFARKIYLFLLLCIVTSKFNYCFAQPSNDEPCGSISLSVTAGTPFDEVCTSGVLFSEIGATISVFPFTSYYSSVNKYDVWFKFVVPSSGNVMINTSEANSPAGSSTQNGNYDLTINTFSASACGGTMTQIAYNDDGGNSDIGIYNPIVRMYGRTPGQTIYIRIAPLSTTTGMGSYSFRICVKNLGNATPPPISSSGFVGIGNPNPEGHLDINGDAIIRRDFYVGRNSSFNGNTTFNGNLSFNGGITINKDASMKGNLVVEDSLISQGYTRLGAISDGAPKIKMKKLVIPVGPAVDGFQSYPMGGGITDAKVIGVQIFVTYANPWKIPASYRDAAGYEFNYQVQSNNIVIINKAGNSANIGSKPFTVLITYEE